MGPYLEAQLEENSGLVEPNRFCAVDFMVAPAIHSLLPLKEGTQLCKGFPRLLNWL